MKPMFTSLRVTTPPASEPITLAVAKKYARIYSTYEDALVTGLITTARTMVEQYLSRVLVTQTLQWVMKPMHANDANYSSTFGQFGVSGMGGICHMTLELPRAPVASVSSVIVRDYNGTDVTLDPSTYTLDTLLDPARMAIYWQTVTSLPSPPVLPYQHIAINFIAGYADPTTIPTPITQAILLLVNYLYENRGDSAAEPEMPRAVYNLLDQYRAVFFGGAV